MKVSTYDHIHTAKWNFFLTSIYTLTKVEKKGTKVRYRKPVAKRAQLTIELTLPSGSDPVKVENKGV